MCRVTPLALSVILAGCSSGLVAVSPTPTVARGYEIGAVHRASVGEPLFEVETADQVPMFEAVRSIASSRNIFGGGWPQIRRGEVFKAVLRNGDDGSYVIEPVHPSSRWPQGLGVVVAADGLVLGWSGARGGVERDPKRFGGEPVFEPVEGVLEQEGAFRAQIVYSGLDGRTLHAVYREYAGDFIRPAFSQNLQYDLNESNTLSFRTVRIEVIRATNTEIEYRIVSDGDLPWLPGR